jgi:hypothetical protein
VNFPSRRDHVRNYCAIAYLLQGLESSVNGAQYTLPPISAKDRQQVHQFFVHVHSLNLKSAKLFDQRPTLLDCAAELLMQSRFRLLHGYALDFVKKRGDGMYDVGFFFLCVRV